MGLKTTKVAVAAILIALLTIGTGYALVYEGKTTNTDNTSTVTYVTVGGDAASMSFSSNVYYDTVNEGITGALTTTYTLNTDSEQVKTISGKSVVELGKIVLTITEVGQENDYTITMKANGTGTIMEGTYYVVFSNESTNLKTVSHSSFDVTSETISKGTTSVTVTLYVDATSINAKLTADPSVAPQPLNGVGFEFTAKATATVA